MKIRQGDVVQVISGSYVGKQGRVLKVINSKNRLVVEGINMLKKHQIDTISRDGSRFFYYLFIYYYIFY